MLFNRDDRLVNLLNQADSKNLELIEEINKKEDEIDRLNNIIKELSKDVDMWNKKYNEQFNIITELEKWLEDKQDLTCGCGITVDYLFAYENCLDKLKALKENK